MSYILQGPWESQGVTIEHRALCNHMYSVLERLALPTPASFATVSTMAADLGNTMVFASSCTGGCLHILSLARVVNPSAMADYFSHHAIDCLKIAPTHLAALHTSPHPEPIFPRRLLILGGRHPVQTVGESLQRLAPSCIILNNGPTEGHVGPP